MVCGWPILDPFFQQLCSRQVMVAASLSLYICWNIHQPMCVGIFSSLCVLEYSASTCMLEYSVTCMLEYSASTCMLEYSVTCMLEFSVAWMLDLTRVGKLFSLDSMFGILVRVVIILDSTCVHLPGFRLESCDGIIMCVHVEFQLVNLPHCTS